MAGPIKISVLADVQGAVSQLSSLGSSAKQITKALAGKKTLDVDSSGAKRQLTEVSSALRKVAGRTSRVRVDADTASARTKIEQLSRAGRRSYKVPFGLDTSSANRSLSQFERRMQQVKRESDFSKGVAGLAKTAGKFTLVGTAVAVAGGAALGFANGMRTSITTAATFESKLNGIKAVSGATGAEMKKLSDKALQLGKDTTFGASDAADAMSELVKAGVSIPDVLNGAADATVALAAASGVELPEAATIASNAMNQFGLTAKDLPKVVDSIAGAANASAIDVSDFGQSMSQVGAVANGLGVPFKDVSVAVAELGNAGIKGSDAGTSLKTMLTRLVPSTKAAKAEMADLGLYTEKGGSAFFDAKGKILPFEQIQGKLARATRNLTDEQKAQSLQTIFGSDAQRAAIILTENGAKGFEKMASAIGKVKAADVAKTRLEGFNGALEQLKGSLETGAITFGTRLLPVLTSGVDGLTKLYETISEGFPKTETFGKIKEIFAGVGDAFKVFTTTVSGAGDSFDTLGDALDGKVSGALEGIITLIPPITGAITAMAEIFLSAVQAMADGSGALGRVFSGLSTAFEGLKSFDLGKVKQGIGEMAGGMKDATAVGLDFGRKVGKSIKGMGDTAVRVTNEIKRNKAVVKIDGDIKSAQSKIKTLQGERKKATSKADRFKIDADIAEAKTKVAQLKAEKTRLTDKPAEVKVKADIAAAESKVKSLKVKLKDPALTKPERIKLEADIAQAEAALGQVKGSLSVIKSKTVTITVATKYTGGRPVAQGPGGSGGQVSASSFGGESPESVQEGNVWGETFTAAAARTIQRVFPEAIRRAVATDALDGVARSVATDAFKAFMGSPDDIEQFSRSMADAVTAARDSFTESRFNLNSGIAGAVANKQQAEADRRRTIADNKRSAEDVARSNIKSLKDANRQVADAEKQLREARAKKVTKDYKSKEKSKDVREAERDLKDAKAARKETLAENRRSVADAERQAKDSLSSANRSVADAKADLKDLRDQLAYLNQSYKGLSTPGKVEAVQNALLNFSKKMTAISEQRQAVAEKLAAANQAFADAVQLRDDSVAQYRSQALSFAGLASIDIKAAEAVAEGMEAVADPGPFAKIQTGLSDRLAAITGFTQNLKQLAANGLGNGLLKQLADMGPETGLAYADGILQGGAGGIASLNQLQGQIDQAAKELGQFGGDQFFQTGVDSAKKLVDGLQEESDKLTKQAAAMAEAFQKQFLDSLQLPPAVVDVVNRYFNDLANSKLTASVINPTGAGTTTSGPAAKASVVITLPAESQINDAESGRTVIRQLKAAAKQYGTVEFKELVK